MDSHQDKDRQEESPVIATVAVSVPSVATLSDEGADSHLTSDTSPRERTPFKFHVDTDYDLTDDTKTAFTTFHSLVPESTLLTDKDIKDIVAADACKFLRESKAYTTDNEQSVLSFVVDRYRYVHDQVKTAVSTIISNAGFAIAREVVDSIAAFAADSAAKVIAKFATIVFIDNKPFEDINAASQAASAAIDKVLRSYLSVITYSGHAYALKSCSVQEATGLANIVLALRTDVLHAISGDLSPLDTIARTACAIAEDAITNFRLVMIMLPHSGDSSNSSVDYLIKVNSLAFSTFMAITRPDFCFIGAGQACPEMSRDDQKLRREHFSGLAKRIALSICKSSFDLYCGVYSALKNTALREVGKRGDISVAVDDAALFAMTKMSNCCKATFERILEAYEAIPPTKPGLTLCWDTLVKILSVAASAVEDDSDKFPTNYLDIFSLVLNGGEVPADASKVAIEVATSTANVHVFVYECYIFIPVLRPSDKDSRAARMLMTSIEGHVASHISDNLVRVANPLHPTSYCADHFTDRATLSLIAIFEKTYDDALCSSSECGAEEAARTAAKTFSAKFYTECTAIVKK